MRAMTAAKSNVSAMLDELIDRSRQLRQEEITKPDHRTRASHVRVMGRAADFYQKSKPFHLLTPPDGKGVYVTQSWID